MTAICCSAGSARNSASVSDQGSIPDEGDWLVSLWPGRLPCGFGVRPARAKPQRSEEHTSELQSLMRISYAVFCLKKKKQTERTTEHYKAQPQNLKTIRENSYQT